jgi:hypothetical protein
MFRLFDILGDKQKEEFVEYKSFNQGDFIVVRVKEFFEKTHILLSWKSDHIELKPRPIIVLKVQNDLITIVATSTYEQFIYNRPKISLTNCFLQKKSKEECFIDLESEVFLFTRDGKRFKYYIKSQAFIDLYREGKLVECGSCSMLVPLIEKSIGKAKDNVCK